MMLLLDTCTLLWMGDPGKLSLRARELIEEPENDLFLSSISMFEIGVKVKRKKLELAMPASRWFREIAEYYKIEEINLDAPTLLAAVELPEIHRDPADRILIATAHRKHLTLLTPDPLIAKYPKISVEW